MTEFRKDIQGLRALAILAVLIFHINPLKLSGGFVGVDMFFVISGFLITQHIFRDLEKGTFSLRTFYLKRIRRLYPALIVTLLIASIAVYKIYLPADIQQYGPSLISTILYVSNIFFLQQSDYFNSELENSPLLHTWSLSVEEQFYIFLPLLMLLIFCKFRKLFVPLLCVIACISFLASELLLDEYRTASFFLSPTRFWQFMLGGLVAFTPPP